LNPTGIHSRQAGTPVVSDETTVPSATRRAGAASIPTVAGYEVLEELGRGGMGVVYKARHIALNRVVALKLLLVGTHAAQADRDRFRTEAEAAARLNHPHIVQVYEVGEHDGCPFVALEYCDGGSLRHRLAGTPLPPAEAAALALALAQAVQHAHEHGIVHRDLKPANVLLAADPAKPQTAVPKVTDFGLAKKIDADQGQTQSGAILGTPGYMAPEQAAGDSRHVGPPADLHALGAILYELLVGRPPYKAATLLETLEQVRTREPVALRLLAPRVPRDLETICHKCLRKEPGKRYATAQDLAEDLGRFLTGQPIHARPSGPLERCWRWVRRNPWLAAASAVVLLLLVAVAAVSLGAYLTIRAMNHALRAEMEAKEEQRLEAESARRLADQRYQQIRRTMDLFVNRVQNELADAPFTGAVRQRLAGLTLERLRDQQDDGSGLADRGRIGALLKVADLAWQQNQHARAAGLYREAHALAEKQHRQHPDSDLAAGNLALILTRLARIAQHEKKPAQVRQHIQQVLALQKGIVERPRGKELRPDEARLSLARTYEMIGQAQQALKLREEVMARWPGDQARGDLAWSCVRLASQTTDPGRKKALLERCVQLRDELVRREPGSANRKVQLALALAELGDEELFSGRPKKAGQHYDRYLTLYRQLCHSDEVLLHRRQLGLAYYRSGTAALRRGDHTASARDFQQCLRLREEFVRERPGNLSGKIELMLAQARVGHHAAAAATAAALNRQAGRNVRILFQAACGYALSSAAIGPGKTDVELSDEERQARIRYRSEALAIVQKMLAAGYRNRRELETDPDLDALRGEPAFQAALARLK
jgi:tetratricopeptide (TPR) repeat protein